VKVLLRFAVVISLLSISFIQAMPVKACSCVPVLPSSIFTEADAVFHGIVIGVNQINASPFYELISGFFVNYSLPVSAQQDSITTFWVSESWKGVSTSNAVIYTSALQGCPYEFKLGQDYVVYGEYDTRNQLVIPGGLCSGTKISAQAAEDLDYLHSLPKLALTMTDSPWLNFWITWFSIIFIGIFSTVLLFVRHRTKSQNDTKAV
jgi:hypothetical protein